MPTAKKIDPSQRIIEAARALFLEHGVGDVTTDMLAKAANVSKATMYNRFANKEEILGAVLDEECKGFLDPDGDLPENFEEFRFCLNDFGVKLLTLISDPEIIQFERLMHTQLLSNEELAQFFFTRAIEKTNFQMTGLITLGLEKGYIQSDQSAELLADVLLSGWRGKNYERALYGFADAQHDDIAKRVCDVLKIVLDI